MRTSASSSSDVSALGPLVALLVLPWSVVLSNGDVSLVLAWGLVHPAPLAVTNLYDYLFVYTSGLPPRLVAWPASVFLYAGGFASALGGRFLGREDRRVTASLLGLAAVEHLWFALGTSRAGVVVLPIAAVLLVATAWLALGR